MAGFSRRMQKEPRATRLLALALAVLIWSAGGALAQEYEVPSNGRASAILPASMIAGPYHRVREEVVSYGYMYHYTVDSDFGTFEVTGDMALRKLLREIPAIAALSEIKQGDGGHLDHHQA